MSAGATVPEHRLGVPGVSYRDLLNAVDRGFCLVEVLFDTAGQAVDYRFIEVNAAFEALTGLTDATGHTMRSLRPQHEEHWYEAYGRVARTGEPMRFVNYAAALGRWFDVYALRVGSPEQCTVGIFFNDITDRRRDQERLALLATEIDHRANNLLAVVISMAQLTRAETVADYRTKLVGRLNALARSQRLLSQRNSESADLGRLVEEEMEGHIGAGDGRATWEGPSIRLSPTAVQCVAMTLHELATNATKYGALSAPDGRVAITWCGADDRLVLRWSESGGPSVAAPEHQGTGSRVISSCIRGQLKGQITFDWRRDGLVCEISIPLPPESMAPVA